MHDIDALWQVILWGLGICATGFFIMLGMVIKTSKDVAIPLQEIRDALLGTLSPKRPGLISEFYALRAEFEKFKVECARNHKFDTRHNE